MIDLAATFRSYALDKDNCPRMDTEVVYVRVGLLSEAAARIERLEEALRDIATGKVIEVPFVQAIARAALGEEPSK